MLKSSLCDYSKARILVKGTITVEKETVPARNKANKNVIFKNCAPFIRWCSVYWCSNANV